MKHYINLLLITHLQGQYIKRIKSTWMRNQPRFAKSVVYFIDNIPWSVHVFKKIYISNTFQNAFKILFFFLQMKTLNKFDISSFIAPMKANITTHIYNTTSRNGIPQDSHRSHCCFGGKTATVQQLQCVLLPGGYRNRLYHTHYLGTLWKSGVKMWNCTQLYWIFFPFPDFW